MTLAPALRSLLRRIKASPVAYDPDLWLQVVAPDGDAVQHAALKQALGRIRVPTLSRDPARLAALQAGLAAKKLAAFLVPRADGHQGEYLAAQDERLAFLTGFTGSAGLAVVLPDQAALFVDGRYTLQAPAETEGVAIACRHFREPPAPDWLAAQVKAGDRIGYDPSLHSVRELERWEKALSAKGAKLVALPRNPVDALWRGRPGAPFAPVFAYPLERSGEASADKRGRLAGVLKAAGAKATLLNQLDSIAWLLNVRGGDTPETPLVQSFLLLHDDGAADWFVDVQKLAPGVREHLGNSVQILPYDGVGEALKRLSGATIMLDPDAATAAMAGLCRKAGAKILHGADPVVAVKARKNAVEIAGARAAHLRDGAAMVRFLCWLDRAAGRGVSELQVMNKLEQVRGEHPLHRGPSFTTIAGAGPNGAIVHYRATAATNRSMEQGTFLLLDSGAQYEDGTTDITRTIPVGEVSAQMKRHFTLVLKGNLAVAMARFPKGTNGVALDGFARQALWRAGLNFDHGTGHGVGAYLGVHEGPARLSPAGTVPLEEGMILSNEPGFYLRGAYGIRIETLVLVKESAAEGFFEFETLTLCPIDRRAIDKSLLDREELAALNAYHARCREALSPLLTGAPLAWLNRMTRPL